MTETIVFKKKPLDISLYLYIIMVTIIIINDCHPDAGGIFMEGETGMKTLKYSRQRESIKNCLMNRTDHPTADALYLSIREEFPNISLGTVYRNLKLLSELGEIARFSCGDGSEHFDYVTEPHYHFVCKTCGAIIDLPQSLVHKTEELMTGPAPGRVDSHTIFFYGECSECQQKIKIIC